MKLFQTRHFVLLSAGVALAAAAAQSSGPAINADHVDSNYRYTLTSNGDEFSTNLEQKWTHDLGNWIGTIPGAFKPANANLNSKGSLELVAKKDPGFAPPGIDSGCDCGFKEISTGIVVSKQLFKHGFFEISASFPSSISLLSSFWLQGTKGEINVVDNMGGTNKAMTNNYHCFDMDGTGASTTDDEFEMLSALPASFDPAAMHTYGIDWSATTVDYYVDGDKIRSVSAGCLDDEMNVILSLETASGAAAPQGNFNEVATIAYFRHYTKAEKPTFELATFVAADKYCKVSSSERKSLGAKSTDECAQAVADDAWCGTRFYGKDGVRCTCIKAGLDCIQKSSSAGNAIYDSTAERPETKPDAALQHATLEAEGKYCKVGDKTNDRKRFTGLSVDECGERTFSDPDCSGTFYGKDGGSCYCIVWGAACNPTKSTSGNSVYTTKQEKQPPKEAALQHATLEAEGKYCKVADKTNDRKRFTGLSVDECGERTFSDPDCSGTFYGKDGGSCYCIVWGAACNPTKSTSGNSVYTTKQEKQPPKQAVATFVTADKYCKVSSSERKSLGAKSTDECAQAVADDAWCGTRFYGKDGVRCNCIKAGLDCIQTNSGAGNSIYDSTFEQTFKVISAGKYCSVADKTTGRKTLDPTSTVAECAAAVRADAFCGTTFYSAVSKTTGANSCYCLPTGATCVQKTSSAGNSIYDALKDGGAGSKPSVGQMRGSTHVGAFASSAAGGGGGGDGGGGNSGGGGAAAAAGIGSLMCVVAIVGVAVHRRRGANAASGADGSTTTRRASVSVSEESGSLAGAGADSAATATTAVRRLSGDLAMAPSLSHSMMEPMAPMSVVEMMAQPECETAVMITALATANLNNSSNNNNSNTDTDTNTDTGTDLNTDNGFVLDAAGSLRVASVKRGNPLFRGSLYVTDEDQVGLAGMDEVSSM